MQENFDLKELMELLDTMQLRLLKEKLIEMNEVDIAAFIEELDSEKTVVVYRMLPKELASDVFACLPVEKQEHIINSITDYELSAIVNDLFVDDAVDMLEELPANVVKRVLKNSTPDTRKLINQFLKYPEGSAGSIMTTEYVDLRKDNTVAQALAHIKKTGIHKETIYTCYVLDNRKLAGIVSAKDLMTMDDDRTMEELMETDIISVYTHTDQEEVARLFSKYDLLAIPVLDMGERMVGIVTVDDAWDVAVDEATEDITKMAAMNPSEKSYFDTSVLQHAKNRIVWLLVLMLSATLTGTLLTRYEEAISVVPLLVAFIPMLMDTGGNCGSQSATLVIRGIALDEIHFKDLFRVVYKEFRISLIVGVILAAANGVRILLMCRNMKLAVIVSISLIGTVVISKIIGCMLPLLAKKVNLDPAIMAAPIITTLVDTCSIAIYFTVATRLFAL